MKQLTVNVQDGGYPIDLIVEDRDAERLRLYLKDAKKAMESALNDLDKNED